MDRSMIISIVYMVALFAIFYFLFIRPQRKKEKQLESIKIKLRSRANGYYNRWNVSYSSKS